MLEQLVLQLGAVTRPSVLKIFANVVNLVKKKDLLLEFASPRQVAG